MNTTNDPETAIDSKADDDRFPSLSSLRLAHSELLKLHREQGIRPETLSQIQQFMLKGRSTGAILDNEDDRWAAQSILDYWSSLLYRAGQEPPDTTLVDFDPALAPDISDDRCPYLGLEAFRTQNQNLFFGRQRLIEKLLDHLKTNRMLVVVGSSGSGKSSVVLGGLLPKLQAGALPGSENWIYYEPLVPSSTPLVALAQRVQPTNSVPINWITKQVAAFKHNPNHLAKLAQLTQRDAVLVIDQFEEVFTLCQDDEARQAFINNLLNFVQTPETQNILILTMRTDFESYVARIPNLWEKFEQSSERVIPLDASELREAIEKPAELVGLKFEAGLVDKLLNDVLGEPAALPLLQFTLLKLWDHREHNRVVWDAYRRLGGGRLALSYSADEFYNHLIPEEQLTVKRILLSMVRPGEGLEVTSNRILRQELYRKGEAIDRVDRVLDKLVAARLVRLTDGDDPANAQVEVAHEALIRNWPLLVDWLEDERVTLRQRLDLRRKAERWQETQGKDQSWLLRGSALQEALSYKDLNQLETQFVRSSRQDERRRKFLSIGSLVVFIAALGMAGLSWFAITSRQAAIRLGQEADARKANTEIQSLSLSANNLWLSHLQLEALIKALGAVRQAEDSGDRIEPETKLQATATLEQIIDQIHEHNRLEGHQNVVRAVQFGPDGKTLASASDDGTVKIWERNGKLLTTFIAHPNRTITAVQFSPDGKILASASSDKTIKLWNLNGKLLTTLKGHQGKVRAVQFSPDGKTLASASDDGTIKIWERNGNQLATFAAHPKSKITAVQFSSDGKTLASASDDKTVKLWQLNGKPITTFKEHQAAVKTIQFSRDGQTITSVDLNKIVKVWKQNGEGVTTLQANPDLVLAVQLSPDGKILATFGTDKILRVWKLNGELITTVGKYQDLIWALQFSPDGQTLASAGDDQTVKLWTVQNKNQEITMLEDNPDRVKQHQANKNTKMQFSPNGEALASVDGDKVIKLWNQDGKLINTLQGHKAKIWAVQFSPDGQLIASAGDDQTIKLWTRDGKLIKTLQGHQKLIRAVQFSPDSQTLASASFDKTIKLWARDGKLIKTLQGHQGPVWAAQFSPDSKMLASTSLDGTIKLWTRNGKLITTLQGHQGRVWAVQFSPDGEILASAGDDKTVKLWTRNGQLITTLPGHRNLVGAVQFSPDGQTLASISFDRTIKLWKRNGQPITTLQGHQGKILGVQFSSGSETLASNSEDNTIKLWKLNGELITTLQSDQSIPLSMKYLNTQTLLSGNSDYEIRLWNFDAHSVEEKSCQWLKDYFSINTEAARRIHDASKQLCP